jgi:hypothetical protein
VTGIQKVHAIVGGYHLAPAPDEVVAKTVAEFKAIIFGARSPSGGSWPRGGAGGCGASSRPGA